MQQASDLPPQQRQKAGVIVSPQPQARLVDHGASRGCHQRIAEECGVVAYQYPVGAKLAAVFLGQRGHAYRPPTREPLFFGALPDAARKSLERRAAGVAPG